MSRFRPGTRGSGHVAGTGWLIEKVSGDAQSDTVLSTLATQVKAKVTKGGVAVQGVAVAFDLEEEGNTSGQSRVYVYTDALGEASTPWTLGPGAGTQHLSASIKHGGKSVTFTATANAGAAAVIRPVSPTSQSGSTSSSVSTLPAIEVLDAQGNPVSGETIAWAVTAGGGTKDDTGATSTGADGKATLVDWTLGASAGLNTVTATLTGIGTVTFNANATSAAPDSLSVSAGGSPGSVVAGQNWGATTFVVKDASLNLLQGVTVNLSAIGGGSIVGNAAPVTDVNGEVQGQLATAPAVGENRLHAEVSKPDGTLIITEVIASTVPGTATKLKMKTHCPPNADSGVALITQPSVALVDANDNEVGAGTNTVTVTISIGDGSVSAGTPFSCVAGVGQAVGLAISDGNGGTDTLRFTPSGGLTGGPHGDGSVDDVAITIAPPIPDHLAWVTQPGAGTAGSNLPSCSVEVVDASGVRIPGYAGAVALSKTSGPGTISGTLTVTCVNGLATFTNYQLDTAGTYVLHVADASGGGITGADSANVVISAAGSSPWGFDYVANGFTALLPCDWSLASRPAPTTMPPGWGVNAADISSGRCTVVDADTFSPVGAHYGVQLPPIGRPSTGEQYVMACKFPWGFGPGSAPVHLWLAQDIIQQFGSASWLYWRYVIAPSSNFVSDPTGTKSAWGQAKQTDAKHTDNKHFELFVGSASKSIQSRLQGMYNPGDTAASTPRTYNLGANLAPAAWANGLWQRWEFLLRMNTLNNFDGEVHRWLDGVKTHAWFGGVTPYQSGTFWCQWSNTSELRFRSAKFEPTNGGSTLTKDEDDYLMVGNILVAVKA